MPPSGVSRAAQPASEPGPSNGKRKRPAQERLREERELPVGLLEEARREALLDPRRGERHLRHESRRAHGEPPHPRRVVDRGAQERRDAAVGRSLEGHEAPVPQAQAQGPEVVRRVEAPPRDAGRIRDQEPHPDGRRVGLEEGRVAGGDARIPAGVRRTARRTAVAPWASRCNASVSRRRRSPRRLEARGKASAIAARAVASLDASAPRKSASSAAARSDGRTRPTASSSSTDHSNRPPLSRSSRTRPRYALGATGGGACARTPMRYAPPAANPANSTARQVSPRFVHAAGVVEDPRGNERGAGETGPQGVEGGLALDRPEAVRQRLHERPRPVAPRRGLPRASAPPRAADAGGDEASREQARHVAPRSGRESGGDGGAPRIFDLGERLLQDREHHVPAHHDEHEAASGRGARTGGRPRARAGPPRSPSAAPRRDAGTSTPQRAGRPSHATTRTRPSRSR